MKRSWPMSYPNNVCKHFHRFSPHIPFTMSLLLLRQPHLFIDLICLAKRSSDPSTLHVAHLRHPKGCQVRIFELTRVQTSASRKKKRSSGCQGNVGNSERDGGGGGSSTRPNVKVNQHGVDVHRFSLSPVGFDPHPCQVDSESGILPTVQRAHPIYKLSQGRHSNPPHLHVEGLNRSQILRTRMQSASEFCVHSNSLSLRTSR